MLEMKTEGGTIRLLYNADGPVERIAIGESSHGECPPLVSKVPVGLGDAAQEIAVLAGVPESAILDALTTSQPPDAQEDDWPFLISYPCGLTERRPTRPSAIARALESAAVFGPSEVIDETTAEVVRVAHGEALDAGLYVLPDGRIVGPEGWERYWERFERNERGLDAAWEAQTDPDY